MLRFRSRSAPREDEVPQGQIREPREVPTLDEDGLRRVDAQAREATVAVLDHAALAVDAFEARAAQRSLHRRG